MKRCAERAENVCKFYPRLCHKCLAFREETNGDWIRGMTDEELAEFLGHSNLCVRIQHGSTWCEDHAICEGCLEEWLKQPVEDLKNVKD